MARITKMQVDYLREKLNKKADALINEKKQRLLKKGPLMFQLEADLCHESFVCWIKKQPKNVLVSAININGLIESNSPPKYYRETVLDQAERAFKEPECYALWVDFLNSKKAGQKIAGVKKAEVELAKETNQISAEVEAIIDKAVFSGTPDSVKGLIESFMAK